jgi:hypothetical protein
MEEQSIKRVLMELVNGACHRTMEMELVVKVPPTPHDSLLIRGELEDESLQNIESRRVARKI